MPPCPVLSKLLQYSNRLTPRGSECHSIQVRLQFCPCSNQVRVEVLLVEPQRALRLHLGNPSHNCLCIPTGLQRCQFLVHHLHPEGNLEVHRYTAWERRPAHLLQSLLGHQREQNRIPLAWLQPPHHRPFSPLPYHAIWLQQSPHPHMRVESSLLGQTYSPCHLRERGGSQSCASPLRFSKTRISRIFVLGY